VAAKETAERSNRAKGQFLATMSHEIRTPMNGLFGTLQLLLASNPTEQQRGHLNLMRTSGELLLAIIDDILDFSKIESGKLELESRVFNLREAMETSLRLIEKQIKEKDIALACDIAPGCPLSVVGDETRYRQVLMNLLNNAAKFTPTGRISLSLKRTGGTDDEPEITLSVSDTGIGIPSDKMDKLFQAFSQVDSSTTRKYGGTGLGLAISKRLAQHMHGDLRVESVEGRGSTFHFASRHRRADPPVERRESGVEIPTGAPFSGRTALVVEDNRINQKVAADLLGVLGFQVEVAENGRRAVEMVARRRFDVIFMDCQMPVMDGYEATAAIRAMDGRVAKPFLIIAMTANSMSEDRDRCIEAGMDNFIAKPILLDPLCKLLLGHLVDSRGNGKA
jgi:CheY-like chemotaxis protein